MTTTPPPDLDLAAFAEAVSVWEEAAELADHDGEHGAATLMHSHADRLAALGRAISLVLPHWRPHHATLVDVLKIVPNATRNEVVHLLRTFKWISEDTE